LKKSLTTTLALAPSAGEGTTDTKGLRKRLDRRFSFMSFVVEKGFPVHQEGE